MRLARLAPIVLILAPLTLAQDAVSWPRPAAGWWEKLKQGDRAVYEVHYGPQTTRLVLTIEKVEQHQVTYTAQEFLGEQPTPLQRQTIDARSDEELNGDLPPAAQLKKLGEEKLEVGGRAFACTVFEITLPAEQTTLKAWHCADLPPIFSGGNVKVEAKAAGEPTSITLVELTLASAPPPKAPEAPGGEKKTE